MAVISRKWRLLAGAVTVLAAAAGIYALAGFFLAPYLVQSRVWPALSAKLGGHFHAERTEFNPFTFSLSVSGFSLKTPDGSELAAIGVIDFDVDALSSLKTGALVAKGRVGRPSLDILIDQQGRPNFGFLMPKKEKPQPDSRTFPFLLTELNIEQGRLAFQDQSRGAGYKTVFSPLELNLANLGTSTKSPAHFRLTAQAEGKERLSAQGDLHLEQPLFEGELNLEELRLSPVAAWLASAQPYSVQDGVLSLTMKYRYGKGKDWEIPSAGAKIGQLSLAREGRPFLEAGAITAQGFVFQPGKRALELNSLDIEQVELKTPTPVQEKDGKPRPTGIGSVKLGGITLDLAGQSLRIGQVDSQGGLLSAWLEKDGSVGFPGLPASPADAPPEQQPAAKPVSPWKVSLDRIELNDYDVALRDFSLDPPAAMRLAHMNLSMKGFNTASAKPFSLSVTTGLNLNGRMALESEITLSPLTANAKVHVDDLSLPPFQPYLDRAVRIRVVKGALSLNADIDYDERPGHMLHAGGDVTVANFVSEDKRWGRNFIDWKTLRLNGLIYEPQRLSIREIVATEPYARAVLTPQGKFNIAENLSPPEQAKKTADGAPAPEKGRRKAEGMTVVIGKILIQNGHANFADMTIRPTSFAADIHELNGDIRGLSSREDAKADVLLDGRLNEGSAVKIFGKINPFKFKAFTDITMDFHDVNMTTLSPYSAKFAGYRIEKGKLTTNLHYKLEDGQLKADNKFVLNHLVLGERVESKNATSLPVRLAVSLLKDKDGNIDVSLPISGDLANPSVSIRELLANAAAELITKLVTSPFTLLANLVGAGAEDLEAVKFAPGKSSLDGTEKNKLALVAKALRERPGLNLDIKGVADRDMDGPALAEIDLTRQLKNMELIETAMSKGGESDGDEGALTDKEYSRLFTELYRAKFPGARELQNLKSGESLTGSLLESAKRKWLESRTVRNMELSNLARARGESIRRYLVKDLGISDQRIYLLAVKISEHGEKEIKALLSVGG